MSDSEGPVNPLDAIGSGLGQDLVAGANACIARLYELDAKAAMPWETSFNPSPDATQVGDIVSPGEARSFLPLDPADFDILFDPFSTRSVALVTEEGNLEVKEDSDSDGVPDYLDTSPYGDENLLALQALLDELLIDTDADGTLDFLDLTGCESQIEQMYDKDFERTLEMRKEEAMRGFLSIISMFGNFDLTKSPGKFTEHGGDALTVMVAAGAAQVSLMHSVRLQELPPTSMLQKADFKQLIKQYKNKSKAAKLKNLRALDHFVEAMPRAHPMKAVLQKAIKSAKPKSLFKRT
jgi:hypothetical protein